MTTTVEILDRLVAFDTVSAHSNLALIDYVQDYLQTRGFRVHRSLDATGQKAGIFASLGPATGEGILLSGHTDVVPVTGQSWTKDPFKLTRDGERLYGRGTTDMKGYLASVLCLADRAAKTQLHEPLKIAFSYDEEIGCLGISRMITQMEGSIGLPRACFVGEPTNMEIAVGHKGKAALRALCHGQSGHSALAPQFLNALHLAMDFGGALRQLQQDLAEHGARDDAYDVPYSTIHMGILKGGLALNIVPDKAELEFEYRHLPADSSDALLARILAEAERIMARHSQAFPEALIEIDPYNYYPGLDVSEDAPIVSFAQRLAQSNSITKVAFGTEAGHFDKLGVPTVVCGPGSMKGQGHKPDEYVELSELAACDRMMDRILEELCAD